MASNSFNQQKWKIGDSVLGVVIDGNSLLDSKQGLRGSFTDPTSVDNFIDAYGYDLLDPIEAAELQGNVQEAIRFIKKYFLKAENPDGLQIEMPKKISDCNDVRELLMYAGSDSNANFRLWSCSILKIVHIISHIDRDVRTHYFSDIQKQIFDRYYRNLHRDSEGQLYLGRSEDDPLKVNLVEFQTKPKKARDSTIIKLLHKSQSVAEELFDRVGLRIITLNRVDAVRVVHFLEQARIIVAANVKPSRSRNTLVDVDGFRKVLEEHQCYDNSNVDEVSLLSALSKISYPQNKAPENVFSSEHYRALQFTCRQLVKLRNPLGDQIRDLKIATRGQEIDPALLTAIEKVDPKLVLKMVRFFYPYEVQIMDHESYIENEKGRSAHAEYKKAQLRASMLRVMGALATET